MTARDHFTMRAVSEIDFPTYLTIDIYPLSKSDKSAVLAMLHLSTLHYKSLFSGSLYIMV